MGIGGRGLFTYWVQDEAAVGIETNLVLVSMGVSI